MSRFKVSVIIPAYNRAVLLIQALKSLMDQDFPKDDFEIIVVDNNSKDNTRDEIGKFYEEFKGRINFKYLIENRQGDIYARHTGAFHSEGEILLFTDDDATFDKNWISEVVATFAKYPQAGAVGTRISIVWDKKPKQWMFNYESLLGKISHGNDRVCQQTGLFINNGSLAIKKEVFFLVKGNHPGQIGDTLIGDAEVGLCRKLHEMNIPIAFTDRTTMWHHQFVDKNGTFGDVKRRVTNNGIADAYVKIFVLKQYSGTRNFFIQLKNTLLIAKSLLTFNQIKIINSLLKFYQTGSCIKYLKLFVSDEKLISMVNSTDWLFDENYDGGKVILKTNTQKL